MRYLLLVGAHRTVKFKVTYLFNLQTCKYKFKKNLKKVYFKTLTFKCEFTLMNNQIHSHRYDLRLETGSGYPLPIITTAQDCKILRLLSGRMANFHLSRLPRLLQF